MMYELVLVACLTQDHEKCGRFAFREPLASVEACHAKAREHGQQAADNVVAHYLPGSKGGAAVTVHIQCTPAEGK